MNDLIVIGLTAVFFAIAIAYVALCDRIIGPDPELSADGAGRVEASDGMERSTVANSGSVTR